MSRPGVGQTERSESSGLLRLAVTRLFCLRRPQKALAAVSSQIVEEGSGIAPAALLGRVSNEALVVKIGYFMAHVQTGDMLALMPFGD